MADFNTWTIIFLFAAVQGLFVSAVLLVRKDKHPSRRILGAIPFFFSLILLEYALFWTHVDYYFPFLMGWSNCFIFLLGPLFFLYFKSVFNSAGIVRRDWLHFSIFAVSLILPAPFFVASMEWKQALLLKEVTQEYAYFKGYEWLGIAHMGIYLVLIIRDFYPRSRSTREVSRWFKWLTGFFAAFIGSYASYFILSRFSFFNPAWDYAISFCMLFFIYFLSWFGYLQPKVFSGFRLFEKEEVQPDLSVKYKKSPVSGETGSAIIEQINTVMNSQKIYLQSDISLDKLAAECGVSKHYVSQVINEQLRMNFFEYINSLRIGEAKELLLKPKEELTIIEIAYQVGYNNKVSFNKAFKQLTGLTPTEYRSVSGNSVTR